MSIRTFVILLIVAATPSLAADPGKACNCSDAFADLVVKLEANYIGLRQRQAADRLEGYEEHKATFAGRAAEADASGCTRVLGDFLRFQGDGHVFVFERPEYAAAELETFKNRVRKDAPGRDRLNDLLKQSVTSDGIVGRWSDGTSEIGIVSVGEQYRAYLLASSAEDAEVGQLKAVLAATDDGYEGTYYAYDHSPRYVTSGLYKEGTLLSFGSGVLWGKLESPFTREVAAIDASDPTRPTIDRLDDESVLLSIPSFLIDFGEFRQFLAEHRKLLAGSKRLVIDIRGNTGGNAIYFPLLELFATRNMPDSQGLVLASQDTLAYFAARAKGSPMNSQVAKDIEARMGSIVDGPAYAEKKMKRAKTKIQTVAILTDRGCMSAAESFVLHAKAVSDKVKTFGSPTAGVIDYTSVNLLALKSGRRNIYFGYPTSTLHRNIPEEGHNETGILPDVPIDGGVTDKVGFVLESIR